MLNITVDAQEPKDDSLAMTLTIPASEVDRAVKNAYRTISNRYNFQGFRRGRTPRPVIDAQIGREAVLADATNDLLNDAEPLVLDELDRVPVGRLEYGDDVKPVEEHQDYVIEATMELTPTSALTSYGPVAIDMPPEEATEAEVDSQVNLLLSYQTHFHDAEEVRPVVDRDFVTVAIESVKGGERYEDENRIIHVIPTRNVPQGFAAALAFSPEASVEENKTNMIHEIDNVKAGSVTHAVRTTKVNGFSIKEGDIIGLDDKKILAKSDNIETTVLTLIDKLKEDTHEVISLYYGQDVDEADAEALTAKVQEAFPDCEVDFHNGGQPVYYYLVSLE